MNRIRILLIKRSCLFLIGIFFFFLIPDDVRPDVIRPVEVLVPVSSKAGVARISADHAVRKKDGFHLTYTVPGTYSYTVTNPSFSNELYHVEICVVNADDARLKASCVIRKGKEQKKRERILFESAEEGTQTVRQGRLNGGRLSGGGNVRTGDASLKELWLTALLLSCGSVAGLLLRKRGKKK